MILSQNLVIFFPHLIPKTLLLYFKEFYFKFKLILILFYFTFNSHLSDIMEGIFPYAVNWTIRVAP